MSREDYRPFRDIRGIEDLLLLRARPGAAPATVRLPDDAYYPEICAWLTLPDGADIFPAGGRTLLRATHSGGCGWRLLLTEHGYLRFEAEGEQGPAGDSGVPVHAALDAAQDLRLGLSIGNSGWSLRGTIYAAEASSSARVRLLAGPAEGALSHIGGLYQGLGRELAGALPVDLAPVPETLEVTEGAIEVVAYNAEEADRIVSGAGRPAWDLLPIIPGGSSFEPRRIDERTVEVLSLIHISEPTRPY